MADVVDPAELVVVANTGDDVEIYGAHVSPDPDLVTFWLADLIDSRGWGIDGDSFAVMDGLRELGVDVWFNLGDRDLAVCIERRRRMAEGCRQTEAHAEIADALGVRSRVLPMSDAAVRTRVRAGGDWHELQDFMIRRGGEGPIEDIIFDGADAATMTPEVRAAIADADAIIIGPSNPVISIRPILSVPGMTSALREADAPVVAVSPIVGGEVLKGPTAACMQWAGHELSATGVAEAYQGLIDGLVTDEDPPAMAIPVIVTGTMMSDRASREHVARSTLDFALGLR
jgi:LPPG:FO 2-phospho-L-lactate transferase